MILRGFWRRLFVVDERSNDINFIYPDKKIVEASKATTNSYTNPIIGFVFWNRYKKAFNFLKQNQRRYMIILEIGTSYGFFLPSLCQIADKVIGSDIEPTFNFCKDKTLSSLKQHYSNLDLKIADATCLSEVIEPSSCDVIVAFSTLEHIEAKEKALQEISKCLSPKGIFICEIPTENMIYRLGRKMARYNEAHEGYDYHATEDLIKQYFIKKKMMNSPFGLPLFKIGVYAPREKI
jgi:SAM-dependent methyltransferase